MRPSPEFPPLPALTRAEGEFIDRYLEVLDQVGRINPARGSDTYGHCVPHRPWSRTPEHCATPWR